MKPARSEADIQREVLRALNALPGVFVWRNNSRVVMMPGKEGRQRPVRFGGMKGAPDIIGWRAAFSQFWCAQFIGIEVKRPGQKLTLHQETFMRALSHAGGLGVCVSSAEEAVKAVQG